MTIEEKAKAYDEALKRGDRVSKGKADDREPGTTICEYIFPELKMSKYESIRNGLIALLKCGLEDGSAIAPGFNVTKEQALAWLESQCKQSVEPKWCHHKVDVSDCSEEYRKAYYDGWNNCNMQHSQCKSELDDVVKCLINGMKFYYEGNEEATWGTDKWSIPVKHIIEVLERQSKQPTDKVETKFKEGDYIVPNDITFPETWRVVNIDKDDYYNIQCITNPEYDEIYRVPGFVLEKDYHLWSINDAKDGDIVYYECNDTKNLFIVKSVGEIKDHVEGHFWYFITRNEYEVWDGRLPYSNIASMCNAMPATKEQRDLLFSKMKEVGYDWDSEKKKLSYKKISIVMNFRKIIEQVEELSISSYVKSHQITIDTIEEVIEELRTDELLSHEAIIGSCAYKVNNLIEVMNPEYHYDIEVLTELQHILNRNQENN